ncbi:uncharacterized protein N0V89_002946 [Didymosphaeria variabile]|uniref:Uncharacterized protein n=1 Tax=Didymosphaeria variabile TaxID=1932322 RepID=A0A9W8XTM6_9PLEO|nr:uncharacterized protein N0V89_002946 [Didymosphaeria variabile]KAJ4358364.1 hypothetical protein N0V89_002946 [Didymosphaeria variabile]
MAQFWDSISSAFGRSPSLSESADDYLPPTPSGKRKASTARRPARPSKIRRHSTPRSFLYEEIPEEYEQSPRITGFIGHRNSLDREPLGRSSARKGSAYGGSRTSQRRHSEPQDSAYGGSPTFQRGPPSTPWRRGSINSPRQPGVSYLSGSKKVVESVFPTVTHGEVAESEKPVTTEAVIQAQILANYDDDSDSELSEGEWGRKHFGPAPWVRQQLHMEPVARPEDHSDDRFRLRVNPKFVATPRPESLPEKGTGTPGPKLVLSSGPDTKFQPVSQIKPPILKKPVKGTAVKPVTKSITKPVTKPVTKSTIKLVSEPAVEPPEHIKERTAAPSRRLRNIMKEYGEHPSSCVGQVLEELQEPVYSLRDVEVRDMMWQIQDGMEDIAGFFKGSLPASWAESKSKTLARLYFDEDMRDVSTARVMKCVAGGRWKDEGEWHDIFADTNKRRALVCGIIGNVLVEQVFKHPFFGGDEQTIDALFNVQKELREDEAFARKFASASLLRTPLFGNPPDTSILEPPENLTKHVAAVVAALDAHLRPLLHRFLPLFQGPKAKDSVHLLFIERLTRLVGTAALLSLQMAADPLTVYYFTPVAKGDRFEPEAHEAVNEKDMERTHPRSLKTTFPSEEARRRARNDEAVISMVLMHGLTAYRKGGWEAPESDPDWDGEIVVGRLYAKEEYGEMGYRARLLTRGWVFCKWGRAERFEGGKVGVKRGE